MNIAETAYITTAAWKSPVWPEERDIPIDYSQRPLEFENTWFAERNQKTYSAFLPHRFPNDQPWRVVLIGVWEGMDSVWLLQNILGHSQSFLVGIDAWEAYSKVTQDQIERIEKHAMKNIGWHPKCRLLKGWSKDILPTLQGEHFDLAIVDGDHKAAVYPDAVQSLRLLKPGGWMLFDDVRRSRTRLGPVAKGLRKFLDEYGDRMEFVFAHNFMNCYAKRDVIVNVAGKPL
jgi:predicted O-methyltransferase YrrM